MEKASKTILLVEDQALIAMQEIRQLQNAGYSVVHALKGEKAVEVVNSNPVLVDLILMDINLGEGIDGTVAAQTILRKHDIPIVFLSSHMEPEIVEKTEAITNYGYVVKSSVFVVLDASIKMAFKLFEAQKRINRKNMEAEAANEQLRVTLEKLQNLHEALGASEEKFSRALHLSPDSINLNRLADGVYIEINDGFTKIMGYSKEEVIGRSSLPGDLGIWVHKEDRESLVKGLREKGEVVNLEAEFRRKDGTHTVGMMSARVLEINGEKCILSITREITDRKKIGIALQESERKFRTAFENAPIGVSLTDIDGKLRMVNHAFCEMIGRTRDEVTESDFPKFTHPDDKAPSIEKSRIMLEGTTENVRFTKRYLHRDGHVIWTDISVSLVRKDNGEPDYFIAHILDISEQVKADATLLRTQLLLKSSVESLKGTVILSIDKHFNYLYFNRLYHDTILERYGVDIGIGMNLLKVVPADDFLKASIPFYERAFNGISSKLVEHPQDGSGYYESSYNPILDDKGEIIGATAFASDITERKESEGKIRKLLEEKELILKEVHHRIKNNMGTIRSLLMLQAATLSDANAIAALEDAESRVQSMVVLYEKLYQSENFGKVSVKEYIPLLVDEVLGTLLMNKDILIEKEIDDFTLDTKVLQSLGIIMNELLTNIGKYAFIGRNGGLIRISASRAGNKVSFIIQDDGNGIPESLNFENSTGFGLMLVGMLTRQLNGDIRMERGQGTKIMLEFETGGL